MPLSGFTAAGFNAPYLIPLALIILIADKSERSIKQARWLYFSIGAIREI